MNHPIAGNRVNLVAYVSIWIIIAIIQMSVFIILFKVEPVIGIVDSLTVNIIHGITGLAVWYPIRFNPVKAKNYFAPFFNLVATGLLTVFIWVGLSYFVLSRIFENQEAYLLFLKGSIVVRGLSDFLLFIIMVLVFSLMIYNLNLKEKISNENELRILVREAELNMLKTQINPHFIFNSLNSLSLLTKKDPEKAREMIIKLSEFLRYSLRFGEKESITLREELDSMDKYLDIEKIRFGEKLHYKKNIQQEALSFLIPNMILQPIFENAIKHGVYESVNPVIIELKVKIIEKSLLMEISNGYDPDIIPEKGNGIGLKNIKERLILLYGRYDLIKYSGENGIFKVSILIPGFKNI
ncbi:MAG: histidine kinase [Bacteroidales bacterium]|nr:histidine kinase [Bacteroidales bacterium]MCF8391655.1 histidine kinase [Bacteroidales bacterium]